MYALVHGHVECVKVLLDMGADACHQDMVSALLDHTSIIKGH